MQVGAVPERRAVSERTLGEGALDAGAVEAAGEVRVDPEVQVRRDPPAMSACAQ